MSRLFALDFLRVSLRRQRAECVVGPAKIVDGDTVIVGNETIRLHGIDAPELDQTVWWNGAQIACGMMSLAALEALVAGMDVRCEGIERDRYGRLVAKCFLPNGTDVCERLVASGWALAYRDYSTDYVDAESEARLAERGMWRGIFDKSWEWRASHGSAVVSFSGSSSPPDPRKQPAADVVDCGTAEKRARRPATRAQLAFAVKIAQAKGLALPDVAKLSAEAISRWIQANNNSAPPDPGDRVATPADRVANERRQGSRPGQTPLRETPLKIPYGNKEEALRLGARYRSSGWYAPSGVDLAEFARRGWL